MKLLKHLLLLSCLALAITVFSDSYSSGRAGNGKLVMRAKSTDTGGWKALASKGTEGGGYRSATTKDTDTGGHRSSKAKSTDTGGWKILVLQAKGREDGGRIA